MQQRQGRHILEDVFRRRQGLRVTGAAAGEPVLTIAVAGVDEGNFALKLSS